MDVQSKRTQHICMSVLYLLQDAFSLSESGLYTVPLDGPLPEYVRCVQLAAKP